MSTLQAYPGAKTEMVTFGEGVQGFLAVPERDTGPFTAVVLGHERYGLVQHTLDVAGRFATSGIVCLAPDLYSHWDGDKAALARGELDSEPIPDDDVKTFMSAGVDYLLQHPLVNSQRIAAMGVCLSGAYPLLVNSVRPEIIANIVLYGGAGPGEWAADPPRRTEPYEDILGRITAPVLGIWGEDDHVISVTDMRRLRNVLEDKRKSYEFTLFRNMPHGWINDTMPGRYRPKETEQVWSMILDFIQRIQSGAFPRDRVIWKFESDIAPDYDFTRKVRLA
jgi:carboxymethylenebutenolidase